MEGGALPRAPQVHGGVGQQARQAAQKEDLGEGRGRGGIRRGSIIFRFEPCIAHGHTISAPYKLHSKAIPLPLPPPPLPS